MFGKEKELKEEVNLMEEFEAPEKEKTESRILNETEKEHVGADNIVSFIQRDYDKEEYKDIVDFIKMTYDIYKKQFKRNYDKVSFEWKRAIRGDRFIYCKLTNVATMESRVQLPEILYKIDVKVDDVKTITISGSGIIERGCSFEELRDFVRLFGIRG